MKKCIIILVPMLMLCHSCTEKIHTGENDTETGIVNGITISDDPENVLRKDVKVSLSEESEIILEYRKKDGGKIRKVVSAGPAREHTIRLAIMEAEEEYMIDVYVPGNSEIQATGRFRTGKLPEGSIQMTNLLPEYQYAFDGYIHIADKASGTLYLVNDKGKTVWYEPTMEKSVICSNYDKRTKSFQAIIGFNPDENFTGEYVLVVDLYGNILMKKRYDELENPYFHHDVCMMPDGNIMIINQIREQFDLSAVGGDKNNVVVGDGITLMTIGGKPYWNWSAFSVISPEDDPEIMIQKPGYQFPGVDDWLHANSLAMDGDGNFYISFNKLSQVWKISPEGQLLYRFGKGGDIAIDSETFFFFFQHSVSIPADGELMVFDNGYSSGISRAVLYSIDEKERKAVTELCAAFPEEDYSPNQSSAYLIDRKTIIYASTVKGNVGIMDCGGTVKWRYHCSAPMFRAIYIEDKDL